MRSLAVLTFDALESGDGGSGTAAAAAAVGREGLWLCRAVRTAAPAVECFLWECFCRPGGPENGVVLGRGAL